MVVEHDRSVTGVTDARHTHSAIATGHQMIVWGGLQKVIQGEVWFEDRSITGGLYCYAP